MKTKTVFIGQYINDETGGTAGLRASG